jgi:hypothetical protein
VHGNLGTSTKDSEVRQVAQRQNIFQLAYSPRKAAMRAAPFGLPRPVHASQPLPAE